jgi:hypothetical protein
LRRPGSCAGSRRRRTGKRQGRPTVDREFLLNALQVCFWVALFVVVAFVIINVVDGDE